MSTTNETTNEGHELALRDAVAVGLTLAIPADAIERYQVARWSTPTKYSGETVDERGQRWATVAMPAGPAPRRAADTIPALAFVPRPEGAALARLEVPAKLAGAYAAPTAESDEGAPALPVGSVPAVGFALASALPKGWVDSYGGELRPLVPELGAVDERGTSWMSLSMPIGPPVRRRGAVGDVVALAIVSGGGGSYTAVRMQMTAEDVERFAVQASAPELRGVTLERGLAMLEDALEGHAPASHTLASAEHEE